MRRQTHAKEFGAIESLGEEVGQIVSGGHKRDHQLTRLDDLAHVEVTALDVLSFLMMFWIICEIDGGFVVHRQGERIDRALVEFLQKMTKVDGLLGSLRGSHDLGLTRG